MTWEVSCLLLYKQMSVRILLDPGLGFFILTDSLALGRPTGWGGSGYQYRELAGPPALGGGGARMVPNGLAIGREPPASHFQAVLPTGVSWNLEGFRSCLCSHT